MNKLANIIGIVLCCVFTAFSVEGQTYVQTAPTGNQTVTQPSGTALSVNNLKIPGSIVLGSSGSTLSISGNSSTLLLGQFYNAGDDQLQFGTTRVGNLILSGTGEPSYSSISGDSGNLSLKALGGGIILDGSAGDYDVSVKIAAGNSFSVWDSGSIIACANSETGFFGVGASNACISYDLLDVSNRETLGNGYMHWFADHAPLIYDPQSGNVVGGWNAGISNPANGVISIDSTSNGNAAGTLKAGTLSVGIISMPSGSGGHIIFPDGTIQSTAYAGATCQASLEGSGYVAQGGDYAESVDVAGVKSQYGPGDVMVIDSEHPERFVKSTSPYSTLVAGIYSTKPGYVGRRQKTDPKLSTSEIPMAMVGIVPTKVTTENGPIKVGDLLVTSSIPGYAMKGTDRGAMTGAVMGKALGKLDSGTGEIEVLVSLQ